MKRIVLCLLLFSFVLVSKGQLTHLTELSFSNVALNDYNETETFSLYTEDHFSMVFMNNFGSENDQAYIYNRNTGEFSDFPFRIWNQFRVGDEFFYAGQFIHAQYSNKYFKLTAEGESQLVDDFPVEPTYHYNGKAYGINRGDLWEFSTNPLQMKKIATFDLPISYPPAQISILGDTVYVASVKGYDTFNITDSTYSKPYTDFISSHNLELIPYSELNGRFLYYNSSKEVDLEIYEMGEGMPPRLLVASTPLPYKMAYWYLNANAFRMQTPKGCFTSSGNVTWLNIHDSEPDPLRIWDVLFKIDRSETNPHIKVIREFKRAKSYGNPDANMMAFNDGQKVAALGLFGPEGYEPYGMENDSLVVMKDYIPGPRGSVDEVMYSDLNDFRKSDDPVYWNGKLWFAASLPHYGREIAYSDGTAQGTGVLADLAKGGESLRIVRFAPSGNKMFILVQREDLSVGLYELGSDVPEFDISVENNEYWTSEFGAFPESELFPYNDNKGSRDRLISGGDGFLYYLSHSTTLGSLLGDIPGIYGFNGENDSYYEDNVFRLKKIDAQTGDVSYSKAFRNPDPLSSVKSYHLVKHNSDIVVWGWGMSGFRDEDHEMIPPDGSLPQLVLTRFDTDGNFKSIMALPRNTAQVDVLFLSVLENGNFLTVLKESDSAYPDLYVQEISPEGNIVRNNVISLKYGESTYIRKDDTNDGLYLTHYNIEKQNDIFEAIFFRYSSESGLEELGDIAYQGAMINPDIFIKPSGELWYTGALNGKLLGADNTTNYDLTTEDNFYSVFSLRTSPVVNAFSDLTVLSDAATHYFGSIVHNDEIHLQFLAPVSTQPALDFSQYPSYFTFGSSFNLELYTVQLDKDSHEAARVSQPWKIATLSRGVYLTSIVNQNKDWYQMVVAGHDNIVHVDTLLPPPVYQASMGYRVQLMRRKWEFKASSNNVYDADPDENGNLLNIFPNPNKGTFNILPNNGNRIPYSGYKVFDMQGRVVYSGILPETFNYLQLNFPATLRAGIYQVRFEGEDVSEMHRMVLDK